MPEAVRETPSAAKWFLASGIGTSILRLFCQFGLLHPSYRAADAEVVKSRTLKMLPDAALLLRNLALIGMSCAFSCCGSLENDASDRVFYL